MTDRVKLRATTYYGRIPEWILYHETLSANAIRLYGIFSRIAGQDEAVWPKRKTLLKLARMTVNTLDKSLNQLMEIGAIEREQRHGENGKTISSEYVVVFDDPSIIDCRSTPKTEVGSTPKTEATYLFCEGESLKEKGEGEPPRISKVETPKPEPKPEAPAKDQPSRPSAPKSNMLARDFLGHLREAVVGAGEIYLPPDGHDDQRRWADALERAGVDRGNCERAAVGFWRKFPQKAKKPGVLVGNACAPDALPDMLRQAVAVPNVRATNSPLTSAAMRAHKAEKERQDAMTEDERHEMHLARKKLRDDLLAKAGFGGRAAKANDNNEDRLPPRP